MKEFNNLSLEIDIENNKNFLHKCIEDKKILVIGGAGSIGISYIKAILGFKPSKITIVDINENGLTELTRDLRSSNLLDHNPLYITYPVSLLSATFDKVFDSDCWDIVANFSAHKHVRSEKDGISVEALIKKQCFWNY
ncbi:MAG: polysaccharide biosynthesis protein [Gammaproteobacteria bacterium]